MVRLVFHGGVNEIGGNKILLEDRDIRIWLDFGMSFSRYGTFFEEYMGPRTSPGVRDYVAMNLIPDLDGLYAPDLLEMAGRSPEEPAYDAVLLSHPHDDHAKYISFLHPDIPVYMGDTCKRVRNALEEMESGTVENRVVSYKRREPSGKPGKEVIDRDIRTFRTGDTFTVGHVAVEPVHVDHSIPGSYGFIIHTSQGPIVYTGDVRMHGRNAYMTEEFVETAAEAEPVAVLAEGTRITDTEKEGESEAQVHDTIMEHAQHRAEREGLIVADYSFKDVDRFNTVFKAAEKLGRVLVVDTKPAYLYRAYADDPGLDVPGPGHDRIKIHERAKRSWRTWEQPLLDRDDVVTSQEIGEKPGNYVLALNQWKLNELVDINPEHALYIRSHSEPWDEETRLDEQRVDNWVDHFNMEKVRAHCSGHAPGNQLTQIINGIDADTIIPIHTEHPDAFTGLGDVEQVGQGEHYRIGD